MSAKNSVKKWLFVTVVTVGGLLLYSGDELRAELTAALKAPIETGPDGSRNLFVDLQPSEVCNFGDLDLVLNELRASKGALRLQLSVEELGSKDGVVVFGQPREQKFEGTNMGTYEIKLPKSTGARVFGVFLCSATPEELFKVPCSKKRLLPFGQLFSQYSLDMSPFQSGKKKSAPFAPPKKVEPKIYFSQFLVDDGSSLFALKDSASKNNGKVMENLGVPKAKSDEAMEIISKYSTQLGSLPLTSADKRLQMVLPIFSDEKCNSSESQKK